jgi:hypothetical protein
VTASASASNPWVIHGGSYSGDVDVVVGRIISVQVSFSAPGCSATVGGASSASAGEVVFSYNDSTHALRPVVAGSDLHIWNVSGCSGRFGNGDTARLVLVYSISPNQTITSP